MEVKARIPNSRLIIVGAGKFGRYERMVRSRRLEDVEFCGFVSDEELPRYYQAGDVFCAPATGFESQGIVLLEAMAAGLPIVASNIEGFAAVLTHDVEGLLALPADVDGLAAALIEVLSSPGKRRKMAAQARRHALVYAWPRVSQQVLSYYERLLHERGVSGGEQSARTG